MGLFLIPASLQVVRRDATNEWGDVWGNWSSTRFIRSKPFHNVLFGPIWTPTLSVLTYSQGVPESPKATALEAIWTVCLSQEIPLNPTMPQKCADGSVGGKTPSVGGLMRVGGMLGCRSLIRKSVPWCRAIGNIGLRMAMGCALW